MPEYVVSHQATGDTRSLSKTVSFSWKTDKLDTFVFSESEKQQRY